MNAHRSPAPSIRARVRAEMIGEIKRVALEHLARDGSALSLRAVASEMGMVSSAIYRYFPSRDELLTALIIDAYNSLGEAVETGRRDVDRRDAYLSRWFAVGHTVRKLGPGPPRGVRPDLRQSDPRLQSARGNHRAGVARVGSPGAGHCRGGGRRKAPPARIVAK